MIDIYSLSHVVVISHEWIESTKLHPSRTQFVRRIKSKTTNIGSNMRYAEQIETKNI